MTQYATPSPRVPDGTYTFTRVNVYGPSTPVTVVVHDGSLFAYVTGTISCPAHLLAEQQEGVFAELRKEARYGMVKRVREEWEVAA
ncbi:hypothetical protein DEIPH_ctg017orf0234 [Deinococcus phoenicis]|uniref:Uncharacterized protein n=1 Tax=Deinococcus phoenicis TaxID=1476583 RepID=A0A016QRT3_9DEIO|nr:hypothetical protein [Deinococcus phoenicis]EYB68855.1 hypothetical protein DEIPH_ctg017orf0234 [Deinococcus phoenicis]